MAEANGKEQPLRRVEEDEQEMDREVHKLEKEGKEMEKKSPLPENMPVGPELNQGPHYPGLG